LWHSRVVIEAVVFLFGLAVGSFLNVCIRRIPAGESIVRPASHCPKCNAPIRPYDNIPVLGYLILRGKCRGCATRISAMYPIVELLTGLLFVACLIAFGPTLLAAKWALFSSLIVILFFTDLRERILPDAVNFFGLAAGLVLSLLLPLRDGTALWLVRKLFDVLPPEAAISLLDAILGATLISVPLWLLGQLFSRMIGRQALGFGDVKMMMMAGAFLGPKKTFLTLLGGTLLGSVLGILIVLVLFASGWKSTVAERGSRRGLGSPAGLRWALARRYQLPLGTFLAAAALLVVFWGMPLLEWYEALFD
jgi:leader peptidase (prepilin peptidase)/N-methyltransferase